MKCKALYSLESKEKILMSSSAIMIGALKVYTDLLYIQFVTVCIVFNNFMYKF